MAERPPQESVLRYDKWVEEALCHVIRQALAQVAAEGLPDPHHFFITFLTDAPGVVMPSSLSAQYPEKMTVVLQHQFWSLAVDDDAFEVTLAFQGVNTPLRIPWNAITNFVDPGVNFGLQLKATEAEAEDGAKADGKAGGDAKPKRRARRPAAKPAAKPKDKIKDEPKDQIKAATPEAQADGKSGEVITLDAFRKK